MAGLDAVSLIVPVGEEFRGNSGAAALRPDYPGPSFTRGARPAAVRLRRLRDSLAGSGLDGLALFREARRQLEEGA